MPIKVYDLEWDDGNLDEIARHQVTAIEVFQVLDGSPVFVRNKKQHQARLIMIGPTAGGRILSVPIAETPVDGLWRPATGWVSTEAEKARYRAMRGG